MMNICAIEISPVTEEKSRHEKCISTIRKHSAFRLLFMAVA